MCLVDMERGACLRIRHELDPQAGIGSIRTVPYFANCKRSPNSLTTRSHGPPVFGGGSGGHPSLSGRKPRPGAPVDSGTALRKLPQVEPIADEASSRKTSCQDRARHRAWPSRITQNASPGGFY